MAFDCSYRVNKVWNLYSVGEILKKKIVWLKMVTLATETFVEDGNPSNGNVWLKMVTLATETFG